MDNYPSPLTKTRSTSLSAPLNERREPKSLTERVLEQVETRYNTEYIAFMEGKRPKPAPLDSPHRFQVIIDQLFEEEEKSVIEARLNGALGDSLNNTALKICFSNLASELVQALPAFSLYVKAKVAEADKGKFPPVAKDELDAAVEETLSDRCRLKKLAIKLFRGEVTPDEHVREEDISRARDYVRRRINRQT